ncbi:MAG: translation initiation factor IF-6 [Nitrosopumilaceae archaeon]
MDIIKYDVYRGPNIGIYTNVNDDYVFIPNGFAKSKAEHLADYLDASYVFTSIANTRLIGALMVANNHGILIPRTSAPYEYENLKKSTGLDVTVIDTKYTALGNMISANGKGAVVSPMISKENIKKIEDALDVEAIQKKVAGYHQVGAMVVATDNGAVIHPETDEKDIKTISDVLGVHVEAATINGGIPYVSSGILANNHSAVVGRPTNGPEIMMLTRAFTS